MTKLDPGFLKSLSPVDKLTTYFDDSLRGFGLQCRPSGERRWVIEYRLKASGRGGGKKRLILGSPAEFSPDAARSAAKDILARVRLGKDPQAEARAAREAERAAREATTVVQLVSAFLEQHVRELRKATTYRSYEQALRTWLIPHLGSRAARDVLRADITKLRQAVAAGKAGATDPRGCRPPGGKLIANRVIAITASMYGWAEEAGLVPEGHCNPAKRIKRFQEHSKERFLDSEELTRLGDAITLGTTDGIAWNIDPSKPKSKHVPKQAASQRIKISLHVASVIRLLVFTGVRRSEITGLRWDEVDLKQGLLRLKDSKTGKKTIILNAPALAILAELPQMGIYVFPNRADPLNRPMDNFDKAWRAIIRQANLPGLRIHDLRHTHASTGVSDGMSLPMIGRLLGHKNVNTTARYAHLHHDPVRQASERIGAALQSAMRGGKPSGDVMPLRRGGTDAA